MLLKRIFKTTLLWKSPLLFLASCTSISTDPSPSFHQVKREVVCRSGHSIQWNKTNDNSSCKKEFIEKTLNHQLTVYDVIHITILNNRNLQALYENLGIAQAELVQASLFKNPILECQLRYDNGFGTDKVIEIGAIQNILDILLKPLKKKIACLELETTKNQVTSKVMEIIAESEIAFFKLQAAENILELRKEFLDATEASFDAAARLYKAGNINKLEFAIERSYYEQAKIDVSQSELEVTEAKEELNILMGLWGCQIDWNITDELVKPPKKLIEQRAIESAVIANSLNLRIAREKIYLTATKVGVDTAEILLPELGIGVDSEREIDGNWFVGPQFAVGIPLFDLGQARTAAGRAEVNKLCNEYYALAIELRSAARSSSFKLCNAHKQYHHYEETLIPLAEEVTTETLLQYNAMQLGVFDILSAKKREIETREKAVLTYKNFWIAHTELELLKNGQMKHTTKVD